MKDLAPPLQPPDNGGHEPPNELDELRGHLLGPLERRVLRLERRDRRPPVDPQTVGAVLPEAIALRTAQDDRLGQALAPTFEASLRRSVDRNPQLFVDAVYPTLGPAIRKAIAASMRGMVQSMNTALEHSLSPRGLAWRVEAVRTGRSFGEVVLAHTLLFQVEQVFLIHRETGLLLAHRSADRSAAREGEVVSAMLTALQDFVRDSLQVPEGEQLGAVEVGGTNVWIEHGPEATLAAVVRGDPPEELREDLQFTLERVHAEFGEPLVRFDGDPGPFETAAPLLDECLQVRTAPPRSAPSPALWLILLLLAVGLGFLAVRAVQAERSWQAGLAALRQEPGIIVTEVHGARFRAVPRIEGLADPLARAPEAVLAEAGAPEAVLAFEPYASGNPDIVLLRAERALLRPDSVSLEVSGDSLVARGSAHHRWLERARLVGPVLPGVAGVDVSSVENLDLTAVRDSASALSRQKLRFQSGTDRLSPGQGPQLDDLADALRDLVVRAAGFGLVLEIVVTGHTDARGSEEANLELSRRRAEAVLRALEVRGLDAVPRSAEGVGSSRPLREERTDEDREANRRVTFEVKVLGTEATD